LRFDRINEHQVRCTITSEDLLERQLSVRDMKYGTQQTMDLFRDIVMKASTQYGFNEEQLPIMIEAVPLGPDELMLIISAVEDAEELDPHFAKFAAIESQDSAVQEAPKETFLPSDSDDRLHVGIAAFRSIDEVICFAMNQGSCFPGSSLLYRDETKHLLYVAMLRPENMPAKDFNVFLNSVSEYGMLLENSQVLYAYYAEHGEPVMREPLRILSRL